MFQDLHDPDAWESPCPSPCPKSPGLDLQLQGKWKAKEDLPPDPDLEVLPTRKGKGSEASREGKGSFFGRLFSGK
ncbi:hypothetical protein ACSAZL_12105 [Methanosarcina sp. T3]|uniref:hypothetical protein n=1 Tax=Methanosarcina sp. T3 TaxID=3439062 RepID=UPI003F83E141